ncbi:hypothetical protein MKZ38_003243 [Zalerion maritima]|uniref:Cyclin N-terminal domain-containing protein n=1 Tax=Zalerion maritima TaxID=339359 RepID=A0AAD5RZD1_9PEZI|nr:hypothetical protein MKZ38_003243 [Zalerion maritima]
MMTPQDTPPTLVRTKGKGARKQLPPVVVDDFEYDSEFDEEGYFATYRPLSNLPTPPPSSRHSTVETTSRPLDDDEALDKELLASPDAMGLWLCVRDDILLRNPAIHCPACHLTNLVPPAASLSTPSVPLVHAMLSRAGLPTDTIALAVCILDSLNRKFSMSWRLSCPLTPAPSARHGLNKRHTLPPEAHAALAGYETHEDPEALHIDSIFPEIIVLAALIIATKFTEDSQEPTSWYSGAWGRGLWTCAQINVTERCIMENLNYRILPLWKRDLIADAVTDMHLAGKFALREQERTRRKFEREQKKLKPSKLHHESSKSCGNAVSLGLYTPPEESNYSWV